MDKITKEQKSELIKKCENFERKILNYGDKIKVGMLGQSRLENDFVK